MISKMKQKEILDKIDSEELSLNDVSTYLMRATQVMTEQYTTRMNYLTFKFFMVSFTLGVAGGAIITWVLIS